MNKIVFLKQHRFQFTTKSLEGNERKYSKKTYDFSFYRFHIFIFTQEKLLQFYCFDKCFAEESFSKENLKVIVNTVIEVSGLQI